MTQPAPFLQAQDVILDSIADGVFTVDTDWRISSFNCAAETITGVPRREALGQRCCDVFRSSVCEGECALRRTMKTGKPIVNQAIFIVNSDGHRVPISISTAILRAADGKIHGGVETFRDLSMVEELRKELRGGFTFEDIIGRSPRMQELFAILPQIAESPSTVLLEGASGTGKELVARAIHNLSSRREKPFVAINCGALPDTLLESELFGYRAGAFTDARRDKPGRFALAEGGTVFLDEIGDVSPAMQVRLLRVLQERTYEPLGSVESRHADIRVLAAANRDLEQLVEAGSFREDLFYRINVVRLRLPRLAERREDIPLLLEHFITRFNQLQNKQITGVDPDVLTVLMAHDFPGNVRELENIVEHAFVLCSSGRIQAQHLPAPLRERAAYGPGAARNGAGTLKELEAVHILDAVRRHNGNRKAAAAELDIDPSTLFRKVKALSLKLPDRDGRTR